MPVSSADRDAILDFASEQATPELFRMLALGFFSGMRIGSIADLKVQSLKNAVRDPAAPGLYKISIGPGASPPVQTKFGVTGQVWIPEMLLSDLLNYAQSVRRSQRQVLAMPANRDLLFLTRKGNPYCRRNSEQSTAINTEMVRLRASGMKSGLIALKDFHFHQSRCTFATELAKIAMKSGDPINAIGLVMRALLHRSEATAFKYIKFNESASAKSKAANEFSRAFFCAMEPRCNEQQAFVAHLPIVRLSLLVVCEHRQAYDRLLPHSGRVRKLAWSSVLRSRTAWIWLRSLCPGDR